MQGELLALLFLLMVGILPNENLKNGDDTEQR